MFNAFKYFYQEMNRYILKDRNVLGFKPSPHLLGASSHPERVLIINNYKNHNLKD